MYHVIQMLYDNYFLQAQSLNEKVQLLLDMNMKRSVLKFNGNKFKDFVKTAPRNYSMIIMFTAMVYARITSLRQLYKFFILIGAG